MRKLGRKGDGRVGSIRVKIYLHHKKGHFSK